jgi:uncharacterized protein YbbC (DUF1343 family)
MTGWKRSMSWPETGLSWTAPSPNIPHFENAVGCAMLGATGELGILAIGVGTDAPFLRIGSTLMPTSTVERLADSTFGNLATITADNFTAMNAGISKNYNGIRLTLSKPLSSLPSIYTAQYKLLEAMMRDTAFRNSIDKLPQSTNAMFEKVTGMHGLLGMLRRCEDLTSLFATWQHDAEEFRRMRAPYLLYK